MSNEKKKIKQNFRKGGSNSPVKKEFKTKQKDGFVLQIGEVLQSFGNGKFKVQLDNEIEIVASLAGKMRMNYIRILPGDKVELELSVYDLSKGRITRRL